MTDKRTDLLIDLNNLEAQLKGLFGDAYVKAVKLPDVKAAIAAGETFTWSKNGTARRQLTSILKTLSSDTQVVIKNSVNTAWKAGEDKVTNTLSATFGKTKQSKEAAEAISERAIAEHRAKGKTALSHYDAKRGGKTISSRVWNTTNATARKELEVIIQNGILEGKSAAEVSKSIRGYLKEPDKLNRGVKNKKTKQVELSKAAKRYHPGQGVYRSSYKNAMRLARTEINIAYNTAERESYQGNPLIVGYKIVLSNNHTTLVKGVARPFTDMCDYLVGDYPKTFVWTGWHPQCRCRMIPILISDADFSRRMQALVSGELDGWKPSNTITELPTGLIDWVSLNATRLQKSPSKPYWVNDNYKGGDVTKGLSTNKDRAKSAKDLGKEAVDAQREAAPIPKEVLQQYNEAIDDAEDVRAVRTETRKQLKEELGYDVNVWMMDADISLNIAKVLSKEFVLLCREYNLEIPCKKFSTRQLEGVYGQVSYMGKYGASTDIIDKIAAKAQNTGSRVDIRRVAEFAGEKSLCDASRLQLSTLTHEFAHNVFTSNVNRSANALSFESSLRAIKKQYCDELDMFKAKGNKQKAREMYLGRYADLDLDEFLSEAFQEYRNRKTPSKYAKLVGELVDKHFKK